MAKNDKKSSIAIAEVNSSNLDEQLKNTNKMDQEVLDMATEKMEKEEKERKADQLMRVIKKANYQNLHNHIDFKYSEETTEAQKKMMKKQKELLDDIMAGKITVTEYDTKMAELTKEAQKEIEKSGDKRRERISELQKTYGQWYGMYWDDPYIRISRMIRNNQ